MSGEESEITLSERAQHLLKVLIQRFIREGQPVGSRVLSRDSGLDLSPATIRNVLADLEDLGLVSAPHTSAGRVPTALGYRLFVDTLVKLRPISSKDLHTIEREIGAVVDTDGKAVAAQASNLLSHFTQLAGVVTVPREERVVLRQIEFLPLSENRILAILVVNERDVQNRILNSSREYSESELRVAGNFLTEQYAGMDLEGIRKQIVGELDSVRDSMNQTMLDAISIAQHVFDGTEQPKSGYVLAGETRLMDFEELSDIERLRKLFDAFSQKRFLLDLLDRSIAASGVQIFIGEESGYQILDNCTVVSAPYVKDDQVVGVLGVIGPTRMAYERVIPIVDVTARLLGSALNSPS